MSADRSYEPINNQDLATLGRFAAEDREKFFANRPEYRERLLCVALCQGAGQHFVDFANGSSTPNGVKDFDVWSFFAEIPGERFPADIRNSHVDMGPSKFGRYPNEPERFAGYEGRRIDMFLRALPVEVDADPAEALQAYLKGRRTNSARHLSVKGVVLIEPAARRGEVVWPRVNGAAS